MSTEYEIAAENGHRVRVLAEDEAEAFEAATLVDPDIDMAGAYPVDGRPVGWDGGDPHNAQELGESIDAGDFP